MSSPGADGFLFQFGQLRRRVTVGRAAIFRVTKTAVVDGDHEADGVVALLARMLFGVGHQLGGDASATERGLHGDVVDPALDLAGNEIPVLPEPEEAGGVAALGSIISTASADVISARTVGVTPCGCTWSS